MDGFRLGQLSIMIAVDEILDTERKTPENEKAMMALVDELKTCLKEDTLINVCQSLSTMAVGKMSLENELLGGKRQVTPRDIRIVYAGLRKLSKEFECPEDSDPSPELIIIKRALARVNHVVSLVYATIYGGEYHYRVKIDGKNGIPEFHTKLKIFHGIPQNLLPSRDGGRTDFRINPENVEALYKALLSLEKEERGQGPAEFDKLTIRQRIQQKTSGSRGDEAEFFLKHLPRGLSQWAVVTQS